MAIFWRLMFGHLLADFTFQTNFINYWKRTSLWGMLVHCLMHPAFYVLLTWPYLDEAWLEWSGWRLTGWACVALIFIIHFIEDWWRVYSIRRFNAPDNTAYFALDQVIHYAVILAICLGFIQRGDGFFPEKWPVLGCLFVSVTHLSTVLIYFFEKDLYGQPFPDFEEKYLSMAERLVLSLSFLIPSNGWVFLAPAWLGMMYLVRSRRLLDLSWLSYYVGAGMAVACGLVARFLYYA